MNLAVTFYPAANPAQIPEGWPKTVRELGASAGPLAEGEALMDVESFAAYKAQKQALYDSWEASHSIAASFPESLEKVNSEALRRIVGLLGYTPEQQTSWLTKEVNMTARSAELLRKQIRDVISPEEIAELDAMESFFEKVKAIRAYSNQLSEQIQAGASPDIYTGWPY
jgi:hypothetical protein